jgi:hypothetical protein
LACTWSNPCHDYMFHDLAALERLLPLHRICTTGFTFTFLGKTSFTMFVSLPPSCMPHSPSETTQDVTLAALYVSTKMHDTLKKPQDLLMVSYAIRFPDLAAKSKAIGGDVTMDPEVRDCMIAYRLNDELGFW